MHKLFIAITISTLAVFTSVTMSQNSTSSPYTRYGLGYMNNDGFGLNKAMGGTGFALRSNSNINPLNPASYSAIDSMSHIFEFGFMGQVGQLSDGTSSQVDYDVNISELAMAFPITNWMGFTAGIEPISLIGYEYSVSDLATDPVSGISYRFSGSGGITQAFAGVSVKPLKNLSLGVNAAYYFGSNIYYRSISFEDNPDYSSINTTEDINVGAIHPTFGIQYVQPIGRNYSLTLGGIYELETDLNATQTIETVRTVGGTSQIPTILEQRTNESIGMGIPESYGFGLALEKNNQFTITGDYYIQNWQNAEYYGRTDTLNQRTKISAGFEYVPNYLAQNYFQKVQYRLGTHYSNNYFKVNGEELVDFGISFGVGLPRRYSKTRFNIAFEYGWMGTSNRNLISENYAKLSINFSINSFWFIKRKFE